MKEESEASLLVPLPDEISIYTPGGLKYIVTYKKGLIYFDKKILVVIRL